jgi:hypothetical protein
MDLFNNIKKYDLKLCQILSHNKEDYLSYILRAYFDTNTSQHLLSYKKLDKSGRYAFVYGDYPDLLKYIGMTFPLYFENKNGYMGVYKSLESKTISTYLLHTPKLSIWGHDSITQFLEIDGYRKYNQQSVDFIQNKLHDLIWASHKDLSKGFEIKYEL